MSPGKQNSKAEKNAPKDGTLHNSSTFRFVLWIPAVVLALLLLLLTIGIGIPTIRNAHGGPGGVPNLGDPTYDIHRLNTPRVDGLALRALSAVAATPIVGPLIMRHLLNDNHIELVRELAMQVLEERKASPTLLFHPIARLSTTEFDFHKQAAFMQPTSTALKKGLGRTVRRAGSERYSTVQDYATAFRDGTSTPTEVAHSVLAGIKQLAHLKPFLPETVLQDKILKAAQASEDRIRAGKPLSILDGVPVAVKDEIDVAGMATLAGSDPSSDSPARALQSEDDIIVSRLRGAGAVLIGKTSMVEFGVSPMGYNVHLPGPYNPYNSSHYSGGSSAGSAVAVAAGLVPVAIGFDGGGSIRIPAGFSGTFGLSPTYSRIAFDAPCQVMTSIHAGPIAASAAVTFTSQW